MNTGKENYNQAEANTSVSITIKDWRSEHLFTSVVPVAAEIETRSVDVFIPFEMPVITAYTLYGVTPFGCSKPLDRLGDRSTFHSLWCAGSCRGRPHRLSVFPSR